LPSARRCEHRRPGLEGEDEDEGEWRVPRYYTVEEANRTLPLVRRIVTDIVSAHRERVECIKEYGHLDHDLTSFAERRRHLEEELERLTKTVNDYIEELEKLGVLFKGFEEGLVDFYHMTKERPVFLCWKLGEARIEWWHEVDGGYAGRQPLPKHLLEDEGEGEDEGDDG
jgi:hypothetical protein